MSPRDIIALLGFQVVWLACALGAASGSNLPGVLAAGLYLLLQASSNGMGRADLRTIAMAGLCGLVSESALAASGLVIHAAPWSAYGVAPPWILALWLAFGATMTPTLKALGRSTYWKGATLGVVFGPLAYVAGERLGALSMLNSPILSIVVLAVLWATLFPALLYFRAIQSLR